MSLPTTPALDAIHRAMLEAFPPLSAGAQQTGLALYRLLMEIGPTRRERVAAAMDVPIEQIRERLDEPGMRSQLLFDAADRVIGFGGLAVDATAHRVTMDDRPAFTWCAWDAFFIPGLLGASRAELESPCPATGEPVQLVITPDGVVSPASIEPVVSFTLPNAAHCAESTERSIRCFCQQVRAISSYEAGRAWCRQREGVFLMSLADAFALGRRYNAARFGIRWEHGTHTATLVQASGR